MIFNGGNKLEESLQRLINEFVLSSIKYGEEFENGNIKECNKHSRKAIKIRKQLFDNGQVLALVPYMKHENGYVKSSAAAGVIFVLPDEAKEVLMELRKTGNRLLRLNAEVFLQEWEKGNIKRP